MADELVDYFDENLNHLGTVMKSEAHRSGLWHTSIHCWIVRPSLPGYLLFQKRGADKLLYPNTLDITAAGHYRAGEAIESGVREIMEEIGLDTPFEKLVPLGIKIDVGLTPTILNHEFCRVFLLIEERAPEDYLLGVDEVEGLVQIAIPEGLAMFSGEKKSAIATGIDYDKTTKSWKKVKLEVNTNLFIPRVDPYYYKMFILADRLLRGERHLAI